MHSRFWMALSALAALSACGGGGSSGSSNNPATPAGASGLVPSNGAAPTREAVEAWLNERALGSVNGSSSAPQAVALDFQSVEINDRQVAGSEQIASGVRNESYYPVTVHYTENDTIGGQVESKPVGYQYWFYMDQSGHGNAVGLGPVA